MSHEKAMFIISIIATTCSIASLVFTASIALKCNGKLTRKLEKVFGMEIAEIKNK